MKKLTRVFGMMLMVLAAPLMASAQPQLSLGSATGAQGTQVTLPLSLSGGTGSYAGVNAQIVLPTGVTLLSVTRGPLLSAAFITDANPATRTVIGYSGTGVFSAASGVLLQLNLQIAATAALGTFPVSFSTTNSNPLVNSRYALSSATGESVEQRSPVNGSITITAGAFGFLRVTLEPEGARNAGAKWRRVGTNTWRNSGATESNVPPGAHNVEFLVVPGWNTLPNRSVTVEEGKTRSITGTYTANNSLYVITPVVSGAGGQVTGASTYVHNSLVRLTAVPHSGCRFKHWKDQNGAIYSTSAVIEFRATSQQTFTAVFVCGGPITGPLHLLLND